MKLFTNLFIVLFISVAAYLVLNEKAEPTKRIKTKRAVAISGSISKKIGQIPARDPFLFEIQRQRINSETIYKFQSNDTKESYELHESDLDRFGMQINDFNNLNRDNDRPSGVINQRKTKQL